VAGSPSVGLPLVTLWRCFVCGSNGRLRPRGLNRILSKLFAVLVVRGWEQRQTDHGRQGKSAASGRAHVVGGVEVSRGIENDQAIAPFQIVKEINGAGAVGLGKFAVKPS
jgi:hypothetical protein